VKQGLARVSRRVGRLWTRVHGALPVPAERSEGERIATARRRFWSEVAAGRRLADEAQRAAQLGDASLATTSRYLAHIAPSAFSKHRGMAHRELTDTSGAESAAQHDALGVPPPLGLQNRRITDASPCANSSTAL